MIIVHQVGEALGKISGCSCTQLEKYSEAGVRFAEMLLP